MRSTSDIRQNRWNGRFWLRDSIADAHMPMLDWHAAACGLTGMGPFRMAWSVGVFGMEVAEFDQVADEYEEQHRKNVAITGEVPEFFAEYKVRLTCQVVNQNKSDVKRIIDFGSGIGNSVPYFRSFFSQAKLACADVSRRSLEIARGRFGADFEIIGIDEERVQAEDDRFDLAFSACVFHHIPHNEHVRWLRDLYRITRPGGLLIIFEHNPLNPLTVRAVNTCPFDRNARLIRARQLADRCRSAGWSKPQTRYHLFFPRALSVLRPMEPRLSGVPLGGQYSVAAIKQI